MNGQAQDANAIPFQSDTLRWAEGQRVSILAASWPSLLAIVGVPSRDSSIMIHGFLLATGSFTTIDVPGQRRLAERHRRGLPDRKRVTASMRTVPWGPMALSRNRER